MPAPSTMDRPTVEQVLAHPSYPTAIWRLQPSSEGILPVGSGRGGPFNISWEVHGTGDIKLVCVMGLGQIKSGWQTQTLMYGHEQGDKYSVLIYDNRGTGKSDKPLMRYSTSEMALDVIEILEHIGWTSPRQLHILGVSMGGMIAQEIAYAIPTRISTLTLLSTAARIKNTAGFIENLLARAQMFIPKSLSRALLDASNSLFHASWLSAPDGAHIPSLSTPGVLPPISSSDETTESAPNETTPREYGRFETNYERFAAQELTKRLTPGAMPKSGFMLQAIAAGWHHKSKEQLGEIGDKVGRERILVVHGEEDKMITCPHGRVLIEELQPGRGEIRPRVGHVIMMEDREWWAKIMEEHMAKGEGLGRSN